MSFVSEKSKRIPGSMIREMFAMQTGMENVVSFALGEPDFTAPKHVIDATVASFQRGETHYTPNAGIPALREAVAKSYQDRGLDYKPNEILIGAGAISLLCLACTACLDIGDEVLLPDPGWANYKGLMMQVGAVPVPVKVKEENGFMYDVDDLRAAITPKTKMILINSPSNPTGGVASAENLRQIADLAKEKNLYILADEIYRELLWDDEPYTSIASFPGMKDRTVVVDGFSKKYAMTGFRLAYSAAPEELTVTMTKLLENVLSSVNEGVQWGGVAALTGSQDCVEEMKRQYRRRRELIVHGLNAIDKISCMEPKGAFYAFANISRTGLKSWDFAIRLLQEKHVVVVPGTGFGEGGEGFVRLSYATSEETIREGLKRINEFVESL
ncbi:aspartate aminotransferase [Oscillibacter valericigenes Sjm18-20]|nr:aspartate aminotransferase [Oscillibacter valericigenes Sjm18-20]